MTQADLKEYIEYKDGHLYWKKLKPRMAKKLLNAKIGSQGSYYLEFKFNGCNIRLHRAIFLYHHGYLPKYVDHIDGDRYNNKIENLRECTLSQNSMNRKAYGGSSKYKGVCWDKNSKKWKACMKYNKKHVVFGYFNNEIDASICYNDYARKLHGEFANLQAAF